MALAYKFDFFNPAADPANQITRIVRHVVYPPNIRPTKSADLWFPIAHSISVDQNHGFLCSSCGAPDGVIATARSRSN
jgi:hypothetical protein